MNNDALEKLYDIYHKLFHPIGSRGELLVGEDGELWKVRSEGMDFRYVNFRDGSVWSGRKGKCAEDFFRIADPTDIVRWKNKHKLK